MAALSSLLGMAEGADQLLKVPTSPREEAAGTDDAAAVPGEGPDGQKQLQFHGFVDVNVVSLAGC
jgi:hypothetical protein